ELVVQIDHLTVIHLELVGVHDFVHPDVHEGRQRHWSNDRDPVFGVQHCLRIATGSNDLVNGHRQRHLSIHELSVDKRLLRAVGAIRIQDRYARASGQVGNRRDLEEFKPSHIVFATEEGAGERRDNFAAVAEFRGAEEVKREHIPLPSRAAMVVLDIDRRLNHVHVRPKHAAIQLDRCKDTGARRRVQIVISRIVTVRGNDLGRLDAAQRIRAGDAFEIQIREIVGGADGFRPDAGIVVADRQSEAGEAAAQRIAEGESDAFGVLDVIQNVGAAESVIERRDVLPGKQRFLHALIVSVAPEINLQADLKRTIEQVGLGEARRDVRHQRTDLAAKAERFTQSEERSRDSGNAAVEADGVAAPLADLQRDIDRVVAIALQRVRLVFFQGFEIAELIETQDAEIPELRVIRIAFVEHQLAADDFIARRGIAGEIDAANEELLAFVDVHRDVDLIGIRNEFGFRLADVIDVSVLAVELGQVLHAITHFFVRERHSGTQAEYVSQKVGGAEQLDAREVHLAEVVFAALLHGDGDVFGAAEMVFLEQRDMELAMRATGGPQLQGLIQ